MLMQWDIFIQELVQWQWPFTSKLLSSSSQLATNYILENTFIHFLTQELDEKIDISIMFFFKCFFSFDREEDTKETP